MNSLRRISLLCNVGFDLDFKKCDLFLGFDLNKICEFLLGFDLYSIEVFFLPVTD